jgi:hypothetical protein
MSLDDNGQVIVRKESYQLYVEQECAQKRRKGESKSFSRVYIYDLLLIILIVCQTIYDIINRS